MVVGGLCWGGVVGVVGVIGTDVGCAVGCGLGVGFGVGAGVGGISCLFTVISIGVGGGVALTGSALLSNGCEGVSRFVACWPHALKRMVIPSSTTRSHDFLNVKIELLLLNNHQCFATKKLSWSSVTQVLWRCA